MKQITTNGIRIIVMAAFSGLLIFTGCNGNSGSAQPNTVSETGLSKAQPAAPGQLKVVKFRCPQCGFGSDTAGDCPKDKISLVKIGTYYCPECYMTDSVAGNCKMCGVAMKKMEK